MSAAHMIPYGRIHSGVSQQQLHYVRVNKRGRYTQHGISALRKHQRSKSEIHKVSILLGHFIGSWQLTLFLQFICTLVSASSILTTVM